MSLQVSSTAAVHSRSVNTKAANSSLKKRQDSSCYLRWLEWLQGLVRAQDLVLLTCANPKKRTAYHMAGCLPAHATVSAAQMRLVERCASELTAVSAKTGKSPDDSILCIPDVLKDGFESPEYILMIKRSTRTKFDVQTQVTLVRWAFLSIGLIKEQPTVPISDMSFYGGRLTRWSVGQSGRDTPLLHSLSRLMNELKELLAIDNCHLTELSIQKQHVRGVSLLAMSGLRKFDSRLPETDGLLSAVRDAYMDKPLPLNLKNEKSVLPCLANQTAFSEAMTDCDRLLLPLKLSERWFVICVEYRNREFENIEIEAVSTEIRCAVAMALSTDPKTLSVSAALKRMVQKILKRLSVTVWRSLLATVAALAILIFCMVPAEHRISARLSVEASEHQVLIAPVDGFVKSVLAKAGDNVSTGQVLATLDDEELLLQQQKLESEFQQNQQAYARSLATQDRSEITRLKETSALIETELAQLEVQRSRMTIQAPVDGVVLSGTWDDFEGASVFAGDTLFAIGSTSAPRLVLNVSEYDVGFVRVGQAVGIRMSSDPSIVHTGAVTAVLPIAVAKEGKNSVQVHAELDRNIALRPGMLGIGKVLVGSKSRLLQWYERSQSRVVWLAWKAGLI